MYSQEKKNENKTDSSANSFYLYKSSKSSSPYSIISQEPKVTTTLEVPSLIRACSQKVWTQQAGMVIATESIYSLRQSKVMNQSRVWPGNPYRRSGQTGLEVMLQNGPKSIKKKDWGQRHRNANPCHFFFMDIGPFYLRSRTRDKTRAGYTCYIAQSRSECQAPTEMEFLGLQAEGMGGGPRWGCSGKLRAGSAPMSQPWLNGVNTQLLPQQLKSCNNIQPQKTFQSSLGTCQSLEAALLPQAEVVSICLPSPVSAAQHITDPGSGAACTGLHHPEKTELFERPRSAVELSARSLSGSSAELYVKAPASYLCCSCACSHPFLLYGKA